MRCSSRLLLPMLFLLCCFAPERLEGANLLLISPSLSRSLLIHMGKIADLLVLAGHNVTVWIPEMLPIADTGTKLAQQVVRTSAVPPNFLDDIVNADVFSEQAGTYWSRLEEDAAVLKFCELLLQHKEELEPLRASHFDLAFSNMIDFCFPGIIHHLGIRRHIWVSTGPVPDGYRWFLGIPHPLSIVPTLQETILLGPRMTGWERAQNIWQFALSWFSLQRLFWNENALFREHISPDFPPLEQLAAQSELAFVNVDQFLEPAFPTLDKIIPIGGLGLMGPLGELEPELLRAVESGENGAVIFSLGSMTDTRHLDKEKWANLLRAFAHFADHAFVVKISAGDEFAREVVKKEKEAKNVHLFEWLPQTDLLAHPRVRLLISHGGYNSLLEATARGVPILAIPLFFDQFRNAKCVEYRGHSRTLTKADLLDQRKLREEIVEMLTNTSYKQKALRLAKLFREKPNRPEHSLLAWTEFVLANGPLEELVPESVQMSLVQYFCLDIAACALISLAMAGWLIWKAIGLLLLLLFGAKGSGATKNKGKSD